MSKALFLRLLDTPISEKGDRLRQQIADLNADIPVTDTFVATLSTFAAISGSPFAYWAGEKIRDIFINSEPFQTENRKACYGLSTKDNTQFLRLFWEVDPRIINKRWFSCAKGGPYSRFFLDIPLLIEWENDGERLKAYANQKTKEIFGVASWSRWINNWDSFFRSGLTWSMRTSRGLSVRALPAGCIFADKGPAAFVKNDNHTELLALLTILNSSLFLQLVELQLGAADMAARSYEVGVIQRTPIPVKFSDAQRELSLYALEAYILNRQPSLSDEITHVFCLPILAHTLGVYLAERLNTVKQSDINHQFRLEVLQKEIDDSVSELYGVPKLDMTSDQKISTAPNEDEEFLPDEEEDESETSSLNSNPYSLVSDLLMWCVGVAFGRWDVRYALHPETLPALPEPFDPLPVCSPGMLKGANGLPLEDSPQGYPLPVAWRGYLVDDPDRPQDDIVHAVRAVIHLLWGDQAEAMEKEACQILQVPDLRVWFRDPKGFFTWHIKRYSKSRRKAPLYWLAQSAKKNFAIWLYYPRLNPDSLFFAAREYGDAKLNFETAHLEDQQAQLRALGGSNPKAQEKKIAVQAALVAELQTFLKKLDSAALLSLKPDLNDGVLLNLAPLREIVPWKEPARVWDELLRGKYEWSAIAAQLRQKGLVKKA
jgi:hypothetical protein